MRYTCHFHVLLPHICLLVLLPLCITSICYKPSEKVDGCASTLTAAVATPAPSPLPPHLPPHCSYGHACTLTAATVVPAPSLPLLLCHHGRGWAAPRPSPVPSHRHPQHNGDHTRPSLQWEPRQHPHCCHGHTSTLAMATVPSPSWWLQCQHPHCGGHPHHSNSHALATAVAMASLLPQCASITITAVSHHTIIATHQLMSHNDCILLCQLERKRFIVCHGARNATAWGSQSSALGMPSGVSCRVFTWSICWKVKGRAAETSTHNGVWYHFLDHIHSWPLSLFPQSTKSKRYVSLSLS